MGKPTMVARQGRHDDHLVIPEIRYERLIQYVCGDNWRHAHRTEVDGAIGVAIVKSVLEGVDIDPEEMAIHLHAPKYLISRPFSNLAMSGVFQIHQDKDGKMRNRIESDRKLLESRNIHTWCWYAGCASGIVR